MFYLIPYFIQQNYARGIMRGDFQAAGLFVDISGFSVMTEALMVHGPHGAEILAGVMQSIFDPFAESVYSQGGMIIAIEGDAFTALFPIHEDGANGENSAAARALASALKIREENSKNSRIKTPYGSFSIEVKIGMASGEVHWGIIESDNAQRSAYYFQGSSVDGCAEAEHFARAGDILLDFDIFQELSSLVNVEPVDSFIRVVQVKPEKIGLLPQPVQFIPPQVKDRPVEEELLARFFPAALLDQRNANLAQSGEFRQVVNMFINLPTIRNETQLVSFMGTVFELLDRYSGSPSAGGMFKRIDFGDKGSNLLLFWGVPAAYENDVDRALNFIIDLQSLTSIPINAGITCQIAHAGFICTELIEEYTCYGWGLNLAARFMTSARRGEIWVDEEIVRRGKTRFDFEFEGKKEFKGFAEKQSVYILIERKRYSEPFYPGKIIGRKDELKYLDSYLQPLWEGRYAGILVVVGEAGIGKSRLVHAFQEKKDAETPVFWALCQTDEILREPLNPFRYWLLRYFDQSESNPEARNKRNFNRILDEMIESTMDDGPDLAEELDRTRSFLGVLVNLFWSDSLYAQMDPENRSENILLGLLSFFKSASLKQPVIIILEDIQWLDDETRNLMPRLERGFLADETKNYPVAILATSRPRDPLNLLGEGIQFTEVPLGEIESSDMITLAENVLGAPLSDDLRELVVNRAEGNPFFAEQILRYLKEGDYLRLYLDQYHLSETFSPEPLPADIRSLLVARLDRLVTVDVSTGRVHNVKNVVQVASAIGREFEYPLLAEILQNESELKARVRMAEDASIWSALDDIRYLFKNDLLREVAYSMVLVTRRKLFHNGIVHAMEKIYPDEISQHYGQLAYHSVQAGLLDKALHYLQLAGEQARDVFHNRLAKQYFSQALELVTDLDDGYRQESDLEFDLLLEIENLNNLLGNHHEQLINLDNLFEILEKRNPVNQARNGERGLSTSDWLERKSRIINRYASYYIDSGEYRRAVKFASEAVDLAQEIGSTIGVLDATANWAMALYRLSDYEAALEIVENIVPTARQVNDLFRLATLLNLVGLIAMEIMDLGTVKLFFEEAHLVAQKTENLRSEAQILNNLGILAGIQGDFSQVISYYQQSLAIVRKTGYRLMEGLVLGNLGWVSGILGDYAASRSYCEQNLRINREVGSREGEAYALINLSSACIHLEEPVLALSHLSQALDISIQTGDRSAEAWALTYRGHAFFSTGDYSSAERAYQQAYQIRDILEQPNLSTEPLAGLARVEMQINDLPAAQDHVMAILEHLDMGGSLDGTDEPLRIYLTCYQVLNKTDHQHAKRILRKAYNILQTRAQNIKDEQMSRSFLENVPFHRQILTEWDNANL